MSVVTIAVVPNQAEADMVVGLLRANDIDASHGGSALSQGVWPTAGSPIEVVVDESDAARAQEILDSQNG